MFTESPASPVSPTSAFPRSLLVPVMPTNTPEQERDTALSYEEYTATSSSWYNSSTVEPTDTRSRTQNHRIVADFLPRRLAHYEIEYGISKEQMRDLLREEVEKRNEGLSRFVKNGSVAAAEEGVNADQAGWDSTDEKGGITVATSGQANDGAAYARDQGPIWGATPFELRISAFVIVVIRMLYKVLRVFAYPWQVCSIPLACLRSMVMEYSLAFCIGLISGVIATARIGITETDHLKGAPDFCYSR